MTKLNFSHKMFWLIAVLSATAVVFNSCGNGEDDPKPKPPTIAGTYVGTMTVDVVVPAPAEVVFANQNIIITDEGDGLVGLNILNFSFFEIELGNLEITGISTTHADGTTTLSKAGWSDGPIIEDLGGLGTIIKLNSASVTDAGVLTLDIQVDLFAELGEEVFQENVANVTFIGTISK